MTLRTLQKTIHVACRDLGLDADTRRDLQLSVVGKASMADMTEAELARVVEALKVRGFRPASSARGRRPASERADVRYLHVLWRLLAEAGAVRTRGREGLNAFVRARFGASWGASLIDIDALRDAGQIRDVTEALKSMCRRSGVKL